MGPLPVQPPKPRVVKLGDTWVLDTGHADVLHDSWTDAIRHAERICGDYVRRLSLWLVMNGSTGPVHWVGDAPTSLHGNGAASFERTSRDRAEVTCSLCLTLLDREPSVQEPRS